MSPDDCAKCLSHYRTTAFLLEASAAVTAEQGGGSGTVLASLLADYHQRGHRDATPAPTSEATR